MDVQRASDSISTPSFERLAAAIDEVARTHAAMVVTLEGGIHAALRDVLARGGLERALVMAESELPARVAVRPRREEGPVTVVELLEDDHRRLDELAEKVAGGVTRNEPVDTKALRAFVWGLRRHIRIEEDLLFPKFESATGMRSHGPTFVMREEHREIESQLAILDAHTPPNGSASLAAEAADAIGSALAELSALLEEHNMKEERMLYPTSDRVLSDDDRGVLVRAMVLF